MPTYNGSFQVFDPISSAASFDLPIPVSWLDFESKCRDVFKVKFNRVNVRSFGREGQAQSGVDFILSGDAADDPIIGVSCKLRSEGNILSGQKIVNEALNAARSFPLLGSYFVVTTQDHDTKFNRLEVKVKNAMSENGFKGEVVILGRQALRDMIHKDARMISAFYGDRIYRSSIPMNPWVNLAIELAYSGHSEAALKVIDTCESADQPLSAGEESAQFIKTKLLLIKGDALNKMGKDAAAADAYLRAFDLDRNSAVVAGKAILAKAILQSDDALAFASQCLIRWPNDSSIVTYYIQAVTFCSDDVISESEFRQLGSQCPESCTSWVRHLGIRQDPSWVHQAGIWSGNFPESAALQLLWAESQVAEALHYGRQPVRIPLLDKEAAKQVTRAAEIFAERFRELECTTEHGGEEFLGIGVNLVYALTASGQTEAAFDANTRVLAYSKHDQRSCHHSLKQHAMLHALNGNLSSARNMLLPLKKSIHVGNDVVQMLKQIESQLKPRSRNPFIVLPDTFRDR